MPDFTRVALIEVGSNNIRYMVADYSDALTFQTVASEARLHAMHPNAPTESSVGEVNLMVEKFIRDAESHDCMTIFVYGTASCRAVSATFPGTLSPLIRILTPKEEAVAAWVAGFACTDQSAGTVCTVIDEGSGSTEIVRATWNGSEIENISYFSVHLGSVSLLESYKENAKGHTLRVQHVIENMRPEIDAAGLTPSVTGKLFMIGGVATSVGWLATKGTGMQNYRPSEINGSRLTMSMMDDLNGKLNRAWRTDPRSARQAVDTRRDSEDHILKVLSSLPFLAMLAGYFDSGGTYFVSGMGVRHGIGFLIWSGFFDD